MAIYCSALLWHLLSLQQGPLGLYFIFSLVPGATRPQLSLALFWHRAIFSLNMAQGCIQDLMGWCANTSADTTSGYIFCDFPGFVVCFRFWKTQLISNNCTWGEKTHLINVKSVNRQTLAILYGQPTAEIINSRTPRKKKSLPSKIKDK